MAGKIEKLREVNQTLNALLVQMETRMFIENINVDSIKKKTNEEVPIIIIEPNK